MSQVIAIQGIYASAVVADFAAGLAWYEKFMGRPADDQPFPGMAQWRNMGGAGLQLWEDQARAGQSIMTVVVTNLDIEKTRLSASGLTLTDEHSGDFGKVAQLRDPEGNLLHIAEPPKGFVNR